MKSIVTQQKVIARKVLLPIDHFTITTYKHQLKPAPPIGPMVGQRGINIMNFIQEIKRMVIPFAQDVEVRIKVSVYPGKKYIIKKVDVNERTIVRKIRNSLIPSEMKRLIIKNLDSIALNRDTERK